MPYSVDLREKVIDAIKNGMSQIDATYIFNVVRRIIYSWLLIQEKTGSAEPKTEFQKGNRHTIADLEKFKKFFDEHADYIQDEMVMLKKKNRIYSECNEEKRAEFQEKIKEINSSEIIYIDEWE